jgi:uncharacterized membrane protein
VGLCDLQDPKLYVQIVLDVHRKYHTLVTMSFNNDTGFVAALDRVSARLGHFNTFCTPAISLITMFLYNCVFSGMWEVHQSEQRHSPGRVVHKVT